MKALIFNVRFISQVSYGSHTLLKEFIKIEKQNGNTCFNIHKTLYIYIYVWMYLSPMYFRGKKTNSQKYDDHVVLIYILLYNLAFLLLYNLIFLLNIKI